MYIKCKRKIPSGRVPSGMVWRAREKQLITVFLEAMSYVARKTSRVYRGEVFRHKSGRGRTYGNFIGDEYLHTLRLNSKLFDLRVANANPYSRK